MMAGAVFANFARVLMPGLEDEWRFQYATDVTPPAQQYRITYCAECGYRVAGNTHATGMVPECPECQSRLSYMSGTQEEVEQAFNDLIYDMYEEEDMYGTEDA